MSRLSPSWPFCSVFSLSNRFRSLVLLTSLALAGSLMFAACGTSTTSDGTPGASSSPTSSPAPGSTSVPVATATLRPSSGTGDDDCLPLTGFMGIPASGLPGLTFSEPRTEVGIAYTNLARNVIDEALDGAELECVAEIRVNQHVALYSIFRLGQSAGADAADRLQAEFQQAGSGDVITFTSTVGGVNYSVVGITNYSDFADSSAFLYIYEDHVVFLVADAEEGSVGDPTPTPRPSGSSSPTPPPSTRTPVSGAPVGLVAQVDTVFKHRLEEHLNTSLSTDFSFTGNDGQQQTVSVSYAATPPVTTDVTQQLSALVNQLGGQVLSSFSTGGATSVNFSGIAVGDQTVGGLISVLEAVSLYLVVE